MIKNKDNQEQIYDHIHIGNVLQLFLINNVSLSSCFFLPHETILYNKFMNYLRKQYKKYGYQEVETPLMFDKKLWARYHKNICDSPKLAYRGCH